ncbi:MAG: hypothetical protein IH868_07525, partial [Chloroflexi bacterium]|nr:hypothetical protein [Chloroflexota bacterium]
GWSRDKPMFWEHEGNRAVRMGQWKLVREQGFDWELFDMIEDRTELNDLSTANAGLVREMSGMYESWATRCGVLPWPPRTGGWSFPGLRPDGGWDMQTRHGHRL